jgi:hypothetical protein
VNKYIFLKKEGQKLSMSVVVRANKSVDGGFCNNLLFEFALSPAYAGDLRPRSKAQLSPRFG